MAIVAITITDVLSRAERFFMGKSPVHDAMRHLATTLDGMSIPYAVAGALAANVHGHVRTTDDVDILIRQEGLEAFKRAWLGRGWTEVFPGSRGVRDAAHGVKIDMIITGQFPGDGRPKPVAFPDPAACSERRADGIPVVTLPTLLELKIASGMTAPHRPRDLDDVIQLIRKNALPASFGVRLHPYVQDKWTELWGLAQIQEDA